MTGPALGRRRFLGLGALAAGGALAPAGAARAETKAHIGNVFVETSVREERLRLTIDYVTTSAVSEADFTVQLSELDGETAGLPAARVPVEVTGGGDEIANQMVTIPWPDPRLWNLGDPYLYLLHVQMVDADGSPLTAHDPIRFGFREVWTTGKDLVLNGEQVKLRLAPFQLGVSQMLFYTGMGMNAMEFQPHANLWRNGCATGGGYFDGVRQAGSRELLDAADENGWAVLMPTRTINHQRPEFGREDEPTIKTYVEDFWHCARELDRQNRPCILAWCPTINSSSIRVDPATLGKRPSGPEPDWARVVNSVIKSEDPTRLVYHHHSPPGTGDLDLLNFYIGLLPLQERENYLSVWSAAGDVPFGAAEHGPPYSANFFRQRLGEEREGVPYFTEYCAAYLGDEAYSQETDEYVDAIADMEADETSVSHPNGGRFQQRQHLERIGDTTAFFDYLDLFIRNTNMSYRGWGVNGGLFPWIQDIGFGIPPNHEHRGAPPGRMEFDYPELFDTDESIAERPDWANRIYDAYAATMRPLLVFIGGPEEQFTAKDHIYSAGEGVEKTIVAVWDGPGSRQLAVKWSLVADEAVLASGTEEFDLPQGAVEKRPIHFTAPKVTHRTTAQLRLEVRGVGPDGSESDG